MDWFKKPGEPYVEVLNPKWLVSEIAFLDPEGNPITGGPISRRRIHRIMYRNQACYIYTSDPAKPWQIKKYGPGKIKQPDIIGLKLVEFAQTANGEATKYSLSQIEDLVLFLPTGNWATP